MARISFHGAAETVTGSKYLLEAGHSRVLVDCGLFQGLKELRLKNWRELPFDVRRLDAVVLTHAHLDHTGYLPRLSRAGYRGPVYCTGATKRLTRIILLDSATNQERDARYANRKKFTKHKPALPLYKRSDAREVLKRLKTRGRSRWFDPAPGIRMMFHDAGHLLGSNMIEVDVDGRRVLFSGDVGRYQGPLYHDPHPPPPCDYLICESTYGNRNHDPQPVLDQLEGFVLDAVQRGGVMLMASFAIGRAQQLTYLLQVLMHDRRIPRMPIYIDSPMAVDATKIYYQFRKDHDLSEGMLHGRDSVLAGKQVTLVRRIDDSKRLNRIDGPAVIISSSGMMVGGRILHHLRQRLPHARNTILLGGFSAVGTRARRIQDGEETVRIHGREVPVRAHVVRLSTLSGHADRDSLLRWLKPIEPRRVFLTHGEKDSAKALAETLRADRGWNVTVPKLDEGFELD